MDVNMQFKSKEETNSNKLPDAKNQIRNEWTPMHYAAENGSLNVILCMVMRGAGIDPADFF
jgi:ankyrin repeat protein